MKTKKDKRIRLPDGMFFHHGGTGSHGHPALRDRIHLLEKKVEILTTLVVWLSDKQSFSCSVWPPAVVEAFKVLEEEEKK